MSEIIQSSLSNIAIIFLMHLCIDILIKKRKKRHPYYFPTFAIAVISISVIAMLYLPIQYGGYKLDLRFIPLIMFAYKWGWKYVTPVLLITSLWRLEMGSIGAVPGVIFGMVLPVIVGLVFRKFSKNAPNIRFRTLFLMICGGWFVCDVPIIFIVPEGWTIFKEIVFIRLVSFLLTGFTLNFFITNTEKELELREQMLYYAERDPLTGLYNIRFFERRIRPYLHSKKHKYIIMIDIDHFKAINDTYGHLNGDRILKNVAKIINERITQQHRIDSVISRYGGEEFLAFIATTYERNMMRLVESIRKEIEHTLFYTEDLTQQINLTVSIGVSELTDNTKIKKAIEQADQSLYKSKKNGRNQVSYDNGSTLGAAPMSRV